MRLWRNDDTHPEPENTMTYLNLREIALRWCFWDDGAFAEEDGSLEAAEAPFATFCFPASGSVNKSPTASALIS